MKIYNKFVESKTEPTNKNDIWFDGSVFRIYKEGEWIAITLTEEATNRLIQYAKSLDIYVMVTSLPEIGEEKKIYILQTPEGEYSVRLEEYIWENNTWKLVGNFNAVEPILESPFEKGASENSAVLKGGNIAGLKGFYVNAINGDSIYISEVNTEISENIPPIDEQFDNPYAVGDEYSLQLGEIYYNLGVITSINHNLMVVSNLKPIKYDDRLRYYFYVTFKPSLGVVDLGLYTSALGFENSANDFCAHSEGWKNKSIGKYSHTEGKENEAHYCAHVEGSNNIASGNASHAEGTNTQALNSNSHAEGYNTETKGYAGHAEGYYTKVLANYGHAEGYYTKTLGIASHAEGYGKSLENPNLAQGDYSHVEGEKTRALGIAAHSEGGGTVAIGNFSHSEGRFTRAHGLWSHVEGGGIEGDEDNYGAFGPISHCEGYATKTYSSANSAHAEGRFTEANNMAEHACGIYNKSTKSSDASQATQFSIGIGTSESARKNAFEVKQNGDIYIKGFEKPIQTELTELSAEVSGLSERIDNLPTSESSVFEAEYGVTTYDEIVEAYLANKHCICRNGNQFLSLVELNYKGRDKASFSALAGDIQYTVYCLSNNTWGSTFYKVEKTTNKVTDISQSSTDTQYPSAKAVYDALKNLPQGGSSATPDWNAREGEDGYIKNKPFYNNVDYVINKGGEYKNVHNESDVTFNNKILFNLRDIVDNDVITINDGPPVTLEKRYESDGTITLIIEDVSNYLSTYPIIIGNLVTIPEIFIPDTIARKSELTELSAEVGKKQDTITDLATIRSGAAKGATALQSVPATYATKTDVSNAIQTAITNELNADF